jgi:hypothetical protein
MRTILPLGVLTILVSSSSCSEPPPPPPSTVEESDSAGIRIVSNLEVDRVLDWTFTEVFTLGGNGSGGFAFFRVSAASDRLGNTYVLDRGSHRVVIFGPAGDHLATLGRQGGGPGEFNIPVSFAVLPDGQVSVYDVSKHGLVNFAPDGSVLPEERVDVGYTGGRLARSQHLLAVTVTGVGSSPGIAVEQVLGVSGGEARELARLEKAGPTPVTLPSCGITIADLSPFFQPSLVWTLQDTILFASRSADYVIDVVAPDGLTTRYRRNVQPDEATLEMAIAEVGGDMRFGPRVCTASDIAEQVGYAPFIPVIADIEAAPDGTLWVRRHTLPDEPSLVDILDESGEYLGTLPPGSPFPAAFLPDGRIVVKEVDELGVERVVVYRVHRM